MTRTRLYLDIDGVLNALSPNGSNGDEWNCRPKLFHACGFRLRVAMPMVHALERLIEAEDLELVWLTTWLRDDSVDEFVHQLGALKGGRKLRYPAGVGGPETWPDFHDWKWKELARDQSESPSDFIWIDDDEVPIWRKFLGDIPGGDVLAIAPMPYMGINRYHMDEIKRFLGRNNDGNNADTPEVDTQRYAGSQA